MSATVQRNISTIKKLKKEIREHCMCLRFKETPEYYLVIYPDGFYPEGTRVNKEGGKIIALERLLNAMERHWKNN